MAGVGPVLKSRISMVWLPSVMFGELMLMVVWNECGMRLDVKTERRL